MSEHITSHWWCPERRETRLVPRFPNDAAGEHIHTDNGSVCDHGPSDGEWESSDRGCRYGNEDNEPPPPDSPTRDSHPVGATGADSRMERAVSEAHTAPRPVASSSHPVGGDEDEYSSQFWQRMTEEERDETLISMAMCGGGLNSDVGEDVERKLRKRLQLLRSLRSSLATVSRDRDEAHRIIEREKDYHSQTVHAYESLEKELAAVSKDLADARERIRLLDNVIVDHHSASVMRDEHHVCPICTEQGGTEFFLENARYWRRAPRPEETGETTNAE